ncbi:MAG: TadE/TadG family type IV pilus assembly protein [Caenibius sp.]
MLRRFLSCTRGSPAVEMVLVLPIVMILMFGSVELGYYFYNEHKVIDLARNYARYAARTVILDDVACPTATAIKTDILARALVDMPLVTNWATNSDVTVACNSGYATGLYTATGRDGPVVTVKLQGSYTGLFGSLGFADQDLTVRSTQHAAVIGL